MGTPDSLVWEDFTEIKSKWQEEPQCGGQTEAWSRWKEESRQSSKAWALELGEQGENVAVSGVILQHWQPYIMPQLEYGFNLRALRINWRVLCVARNIMTHLIVLKK